MNKRFLTGLLILVCTTFIAGECYAWPPEPYIRIPDWHVHAPVGEYADVYAVVENDYEAGPIEYWVWTKSSGLSFYDTPVEEEYYSAASFYSYSTGRYDVDVTGTDYWSQSDSDWAYFYVFEMDLGIDGVSDEDEEDPGGFICVNDDDDNNNGTPDKDETGTVSGEDDLVPIYLSYEPSSLYPGYVELKIPYDNDNIKVWSSSEKGTLVVPDGSNYYKRWQLGSQPSTLYVEGCSAGSAELDLLYTPDGQNYPGGTKNHDPVKFTVYDICECLPPDIYGYWESFLPGFSCPPNGGANQVAKPDDCENRLAIYCDKNNSAGFEAFSWWYRPAGQTGRGTEVGLCVWTGGVNKFDVFITNKGKHCKERFLKTRHSTKNDNKGSLFNQEGCPDYWCWKVQRYNCVSGTFETGSPWWRRDNDVFWAGWWEDEGESCTGPPYAHPTK